MDRVVRLAIEMSGLTPEEISNLAVQLLEGDSIAASLMVARSLREAIKTRNYKEIGLWLAIDQRMQELKCADSTARKRRKNVKNA